MRINIKENFPNDYISREAGEKLREEILKYSKEKEAIHIDFNQVQIASTSFMDEAFAKLALEGWTEKEFNQRVRLENMDSRDEKVLKQVCKYRGLI